MAGGGDRDVSGYRASMLSEAKIVAITRLGLAGARRDTCCLLAGTALLLALMPSTARAASAITKLGPPPPVFVQPCPGKKVVGPFHTRGSQVYGKGNVPFISYGVTVAFSLDAKTWRSGATAKGDMDEKEIGWAATDWCANTVRIQVNQDLLLPTGGLTNVNVSYLKAIEAEVSDAVSSGLVVVLNDSTESSVNGGSETGPTLTTFSFWLWMASIYGSDPAHVIFDPFNEPRDTNSAMSATQTWNTWFNGNGSYYGMNELAGWVHFIAPRNLLWIEGPNFSDSFAGMVPKYLIPLPNVVYAVHHPKGTDDQKNWTAAFGYLVGKGIPVVEGEWTNFAGGGGGDSACWPNAPTQVPEYLNSYLTGLHIGLSAYTLNSGRLLRQLYAPKTGKEISPDPVEPTVFPQGKTTIGWSCSPSAYKSPGTAGTEGAGEAIYDFFKARNHA
jgi:hypothetical protein